MAFFKSNEKEKEKEKEKKLAISNRKGRDNQANEISPPTAKAGTTISEGITITGDIEGQESVLVNGRLIGNLKVNEVTIGKKGSVEGAIIAKKVIISGNLKGSVVSTNLDIMQTGKVSDKIHVVNLVINGNVVGEVIADDSIIISNGGKAKVHIIKSKRIMVRGEVEGKVIASELLDVGSNGYVKGEICIKNIKTEEGGKVIGTMEAYQEEVVKQVTTPKGSKNKEGEIIDAEIA